jgi:glyoxylase-like metal-dependent hydrolase (beta-lactamase superfamily II)/rhodanese-related sulfurtransferase
MADQNTKEFEITSEELNESLQKNEPMLLFDLRLQDMYKEGHINGSVHAVCDAKAKDTLMPKIPKNVKLVLIDDDGTMSAGTAEMMRSFGLDAYYLKGGMKNWTDKVVRGSPLTAIHPDDLAKKLKDPNVYLLDVRDSDEFSDYNIPGSTNIPLSELFKPENISKIPQDKEIVTICPHSNMASIATFALARNGIKARILEDGLAGWSQVLNSVHAQENPIVIQVEKIGKGCLSHIVISENDAIVIDPLYPAEKYLEIVKQEGAKITHVIDTHQHADHVSAAQQLSELTGAPMYESKLEKWDRQANFLEDGQVVSFGTSKLRVIHTPGHTPGSLSYVVDEKYVFTGDILFIESIGRPDLRDRAEEFAHHLYDSLHNKLLKLPSDTIVFPTHHGPLVNSVNGVFFTTIEKTKQHEILKLSKEDFVKQVVSIVVPRPMNYQRIIQINKGSIPLTPSDVPDLELGPNRCSISGV